MSGQHLKRWLKLARGLLSCPTAALMEDLPAAFIRKFASERTNLFIEVDRYGNLLLGYPRNGRDAKAPLVLVAHMDHPGFWIEHPGMAGSKIRLVFQGGVNGVYAKKGTALLFYRRNCPKPAGKGRLLSIECEESGRLLKAQARCIKGEAPADGFAMWDLPAFKLKNERIVSRACDDLMGCVAALCALDYCNDYGDKKTGPLWALFTRAEEIGFFGALAVTKQKMLPKAACIISLECSKALATAPHGAGVIVRVGDAASIFDPKTTEALRAACIRLQSQDRSFNYQRKLMDGGACEATAFCNAGYRSSGLALPLGNYHNQRDKDGKPAGIASEFVNLQDFEAEVRLLIEMSGQVMTLEQSNSVLRERLRKRAAVGLEALSRMPLLTNAEKSAQNPMLQMGNKFF